MEGGVVDRCREVFVLPTFGARGGRIFFWRLVTEDLAMLG